MTKEIDNLQVETPEQWGRRILKQAVANVSCQRCDTLTHHEHCWRCPECADLLCGDCFVWDYPHRCHEREMRRLEKRQAWFVAALFLALSLFVATR